MQKRTELKGHEFKSIEKLMHDVGIKTFQIELIYLRHFLIHTSFNNDINSKGNFPLEAGECTWTNLKITWTNLKIHSSKRLTKAYSWRIGINQQDKIAETICKKVT